MDLLVRFRRDGSEEPVVLVSGTAVVPAFHRITDVGDGVKVAVARDPFGNLLGVIENRHFAVVSGTG